MGKVFQSTLSVRRATGVNKTNVNEVTISIHALRKESDPIHGWPDGPDRNFNPRSP